MTKSLPLWIAKFRQGDPGPKLSGRNDETPTEVFQLGPQYRFTSTAGFPRFGAGVSPAQKVAATAIICCCLRRTAAAVCASKPEVSFTSPDLKRGVRTRTSSTRQKEPRSSSIVVCSNNSVLYSHSKVKPCAVCSASNLKSS